MKFFQKIHVFILILLCASQTWAHEFQLKAPITSKRFTISKKMVRSIIFSPDGQLVLVSFIKFPAKVYDAQSWELLYTFPGQDEEESFIREAAFSPDSSLIVTAGWEQKVNIWNAKTGEMKRSLKNEDVFKSIAFSPDGEKIVTGLAGGTTIVWNAETGARLFMLSGNYGDIESVTFSPDGETIFTADDNETAKLWDAKTGKFKYALFGAKYWTPASNDRPNHGNHQPWNHTISFSPDSQKILTTSYSDEAKVWDSKSTKLLFGLGMSKKSYLRLAFFSPDGNIIFTASNKDDTAILWNAENAEKMHDLDAKEAIYHAVFSPDSQTLVTTFLENSPKVWDVNSGNVLFSFENDKDFMSAISFSPCGQYFVGGYGEGNVRVWNAKDGTVIKTLTFGES